MPFVISLSDGVPGHIPPRSAFPHGGYEVLEAHRYYGQPAAFAQGVRRGWMGRGKAERAAQLRDACANASQLSWCPKRETANSSGMRATFQDYERYNMHRLGADSMNNHKGTYKKLTG